MQKAAKRIVVLFLCATMLLSAGWAMVNGPKIGEKKLVTATFYHVGGGQYERNPPSGTNCEPDPNYPCQIIYHNAEDVEDMDDFLYAARPDFSKTETDTGVWQ